MIDLDKAYTLQEILKEGLVEGVRSYPTLYYMVTETVETDEQFLNQKHRKGIEKRVLRTDDKRLPAFVEKAPYNRNGRYFVYGRDIVAFNERRKKEKLGKKK